MRKHLAEDFDAIYMLDCGGNVRKNPKLSGTTHNVFGIQVGVSVTFFVKHADGDPATCDIRYFRMEEFLTKEERYAVMNDAEDWRRIAWDELEPDAKHRWLVEPTTREFESYIPVGTKDAKKADWGEAEAIFETYSGGVKTNRDAWSYDFLQSALSERMSEMIAAYNTQVHRWTTRQSRDEGFHEIVEDDDKIIKWSPGLKRRAKSGHTIDFHEANIRAATFRPFTKKSLFALKDLIERPGLFFRFFPTEESELENQVISVTNHSQIPFSCLIHERIVTLEVGGRASQCFPFYVYDEDGTNRRENVTDWALERFRSHYDDATITKRDIFHYVYGVLHHADYRERYEGNLKRQLPRIPFAPDTDAFRGFVEAGAQLAELHVGYEDADPYPLNEVEDDAANYEWRVEKMRFRQNKTAIKYNDFLTLEGIPERAHDYRLGNRSTLDWLVNQYRVRTYKRYDITHDPNDPNNKWYIVDLIKRVTTVSIKTVDIVEGLPELGIPGE
jgi:predicted helicase